jgi:HK97 family phage major capsid protein
MKPYIPTPSLPTTFKSFGEQLLSIRSAAMTSGGRIDPRLHGVNKRAQAAGGSEAVPSDGGFLVAPEFSQDLLKRFYLTGDIFKRCTTFNITKPNRNALSFPAFDETSRANGSRLGGVEAYWENEADQLTSSKPKFNLSTIPTNKLIGLIYITAELLEDSDALGRWVTYALSQELVFHAENSVINGSGAGQPEGVLNSGALITVPKELGQASGTVVAANIEGMLASFWSSSYNSTGACWIVNQALLPQLAALQTVVGTGGSESKLFQWARSVEEFDLLGGFPILLSEYAQVPGTPGDIVLCDFSRYAISQREQIRNELSLEIRFLTDEAAFRAVWRVGGQSIDRAPVASLNGGALTSSFVALAQR